MWASHFHCENYHKKYTDACALYTINCTQILCSRYRDKDQSCSDINDFICFDDDSCKKSARCNGEFDCLNGEDECWCPLDTVDDHAVYRYIISQFRIHTNVY